MVLEFADKSYNLSKIIFTPKWIMLISIVLDKNLMSFDICY